MDLEYFKENICEELEGSKDYIIRAIEIKPMQATWSKMLVEMSAQELMHATNLNNMFNEYCKILTDSYPEMPDYVRKIRDEVAEMYATKSAQIKMMHESYK